MREHWYPLVFSKDLGTKKPYGVEILGDPVVLFRDGSGTAICLSDRCSHRSVPLSLGQLCEGQLECLYHGWRFGAGGACSHIPTLREQDPIPKASRVHAYPVVEKQGLVWVWPGDPANADPELIRIHPEIENGKWTVFCDMVDLDIDHSLIIENLLDPSHVPFTHDGTIGKRKDAQPLAIEIEEYPRGLKASFLHTRDTQLPRQHFTFDMPCTVRLDLVVKPGWDLIQIHHCVPIRQGKLRLLYYFCRNWMTWLPDFLWIRNSRKIIQQDVAMLLGQQERLRQGARAWQCPVKADGIAVRYRKWLERSTDESTWFNGFPLTSAALGDRGEVAGSEEGAARTGAGETAA